MMLSASRRFRCLVLLMLASSPRSAQCDVVDPPPKLVVALRAGTNASDVMSVGDVRPTTRGGVFGELKLSTPATSSVRLSLGGRIGGAWVDFRQPLLASGNIKDQEWQVFLDGDFWLVRPKPFGSYVGVRALYGESRSWLEERTYSVEGPHTYRGGGGVRAGFQANCGSRCAVEGEIGQSVYHAHARDGETTSDFNWLGREMFLTVGVQLRVL